MFTININNISARSPSQILFLKDECSFDFINVQIIVLSHSSANCQYGPRT